MPDETRAQALAKDNKRIKTLRKQLGSISWFMAILSENIARGASREEGCRGNVWRNFVPFRIVNRYFLTRRFLCFKVKAVGEAILHSVEDCVTLPDGFHALNVTMQLGQRARGNQMASLCVSSSSVFFGNLIRCSSGL